METYRVLSPEGRPVVRASARPDRVPDMAQATVGQVWDYRFRGDEVFAALRETLSEAHEGITFVDYATFGDIHGPDADALLADLPRRLSQTGCNAVISGVGA